MILTNFTITASDGTPVIEEAPMSSIIIKEECEWEECYTDDDGEDYFISIPVPNTLFLDEDELRTIFFG